MRVTRDLSHRGYQPLAYGPDMACKIIKSSRWPVKSHNPSTDLEVWQWLLPLLLFTCCQVMVIGSALAGLPQYLGIGPCSHGTGLNQGLMQLHDIRPQPGYSCTAALSPSWSSTAHQMRPLDQIQPMD